MCPFLNAFRLAGWKQGRLALILRIPLIHMSSDKLKKARWSQSSALPVDRRARQWRVLSLWTPTGAKLTQTINFFIALMSISLSEPPKGMNWVIYLSISIHLSIYLSKRLIQEFNPMPPRPPFSTSNPHLTSNHLYWLTVSEIRSKINTVLNIITTSIEWYRQPWKHWHDSMFSKSSSV